MQIDFDAPYLETDPWGYRNRWYEQRRRNLIAAVLPQYDLGSVLEVGCANGLIAQQLADRAKDWLGVDVSSKAVELANQTLAGNPHIKVRQANIAQHWPSGKFDTYLICDVGYYLSPQALEFMAHNIASSAHSSTVMLAAHWRHPFDQVVTPTQQVHQILGHASCLQPLARYTDEDLLLEVWTGNGQSIARTEGFI
ncbi:class I SAM-dependent methyltransferase [Comamonas sp. NoAH]|uniref:class I SAM-dependent methyltransferase n=1 Tax=Comamonas halotolerans TaxID=3041496 RepID=UPI0024E05368|nr:class I SAM-dependent methyltransferase [Comamonas sp. NoAH]